MNIRTDRGVNSVVCGAGYHVPRDGVVDSGPASTGRDHSWSGASAKPGVFVFLILHGSLQMQFGTYYASVA